MADNSSLNAAYHLGVQADKDTAATAYQTGLKTDSSMPGVEWDIYEPGPEHPGPVSRNTDRRSYTQRTGYVAPFSSTGLFYPRLFGYQLRGAGFDVATVDQTTHYEHTFTIAAPADVAYLSIIWAMGAWQRMATGGRLENLSFNATPARIEVSDSGIAMVSDAPAGGETFNAELATPIKPTIGSGSILIDAVELTTDAIRGHQWTVEHGLDTEDFQLWVEGRNDIPQNTIGLSGSFDDIDITQALYQKLVAGGAANTTPDSASVSAVLDILYQSSENIPGAAVPFSLRQQIPTAELTMGDFGASGEDLIRFSAEYAMVDISGEPVTFTLVNDVAAYA